MKNLLLILPILFGFSTNSLAEMLKEHGHGEEKEDGHGKHKGHGPSKAIGVGKAIEAVDEVKGFKMAEVAKNTIGVKLVDVEQGPLIIPKEALVVSLNKKGIYRLRNDFFKMIPAEVEGETFSAYTVAVKDLRQGDQVAVEGVGLLRVTDIYSTDTSEYGHGH